MKHSVRVSHNRAMRYSYYATDFAPAIRSLVKDLGDDFHIVLQALREGDYVEPPNSKNWTAAKLLYHLRQCTLLGIDYIDDGE